MSTTTAADPRTGGMVSIMVMYRPPTASGQPAPGEAKTIDMPPTYDSLFLGENPPGYNMLTVNLPSGGETIVTEDAAAAAAVAANSNIQVVTVDESGSSLLPTTSLATGNTTSASDCQTSVSNTSEDLLTMAAPPASQPEEPLSQQSKQVELIEIDQENENAKEEQPSQTNGEENLRETLPSLLTNIELQKPNQMDPVVLSN